MAVAYKWILIILRGFCGRVEELQKHAQRKFHKNMAEANF